MGSFFAADVDVMVEEVGYILKEAIATGRFLGNGQPAFDEHQFHTRVSIVL